MKDFAGAVAVVGGMGLVAYALYLTNNPQCLWALILVLILAANFPWSK